MEEETSPGPLDGLVVVDASTIIAGPLAAMLLAQYGATVIKVEHPQMGDGSRRLGTTPAQAGLWWKYLSQNKKCVTCKLSTPDGAALFKQLVSKADILIENFRPKTMEKWGLGYDDLKLENPGLVMLRITGFGQQGPYADRPGYGTLAEAMSGFAHMTGEAAGPPTLPGAPLADGLTGIMGAAACLAALWKSGQERSTRKGQEIDLALYSSMIFAFGTYIAEYDQTGLSPARRGNRLGNAPRNAHKCNDGEWVAYSAQSASMLGTIIEFVGLETDPRFTDPLNGLKYADELDAALGGWIAQRPRDEVIEKLVNAGIPIAPVYDTGQLVDDPHVRFRGDITAVDDDEVGSMRMPAAPARLSGGSITKRWTGASTKGAHNEEIYVDWLGMSPNHIAELMRDGVL